MAPTKADWLLLRCALGQGFCAIPAETPSNEARTIRHEQCSTQTYSPQPCRKHWYGADNPQELLAGRLLQLATYPAVPLIESE